MTQISYTQTYSRRRVAGIGIVEVLLALVVMSFGILGIAGMHLGAMKSTKGSFTRAQADLFAEDLAARMRLNRVAAGDGYYDNFTADQNYNCSTRPNILCQATVGRNASMCSASDIAAFDLYAVACGSRFLTKTAKDGVLNGLPNSRLSVECDDVVCNMDSSHTITIFWSEIPPATAGSRNLVDRRVQLKLTP